MNDAHDIQTRQTIERRLRRVIARTERVASTVERDSMMSEPPIAVSIAPADLALQESAKLAMGLEARPTTKQMAEIATRWPTAKPLGSLRALSGKAAGVASRAMLTASSPLISLNEP